jgi:hypothetical protein
MRKITCDHCGKDLTWADDEHNFGRRIALTGERMTRPPRQIEDVHYSPPDIETDLHFCHTGCLVRWFRDNHGDKLAHILAEPK